MHFAEILQPLSDFIVEDKKFADSLPQYWYEGRCPDSGNLLRLPRTLEAETIAHQLMQHLAHYLETLETSDRFSWKGNLHEGKMYGVLLVETAAGERKVLKAFSGLLQGQAIVEGWVPPIPGRDRVALEEAQTLSSLDAIKQELLRLKHLPERNQYAVLSQEFEQRLKDLSLCHQQRKQERQQRRQALCQENVGQENQENIDHLKTLLEKSFNVALAQLDDQSRRDGMERRRFKQQRDATLQPLKQKIDRADARIRELKQQRKILSRQLQTQMHTVYCLTNFAGESASLQQLIDRGAIPTGTGDCCAPKLLHYAATHALKPLAMAEFWWGDTSANGDKVAGEFYGACADRCQPLMGFLLSGLTAEQTSSPATPLFQSDNKEWLLPIVYEDEWLIAVNKPAGLLSVPGRSSDRQDSVLSRLRQILSSNFLTTVHRLDQDTSGILLLARNPEIYRQLNQQFQQRQVRKVYEAILAGEVAPDQGVIELPLWGNPTDRPRQTVDWQRGKPSTTYFQVIAKQENQTRIEFIPITGRTHQLRVHAADARGLGVPILGDRLYGEKRCRDSHSSGDEDKVDRLYLHAKELCLIHPKSGQILVLKAETPF